MNITFALTILAAALATYGTRIGGYLPKDQLEVAIADATAKA